METLTGIPLFHFWSVWQVFRQQIVREPEGVCGSLTAYTPPCFEGADQQRHAYIHNDISHFCLHSIRRHVAGWPCSVDWMWAFWRGWRWGQRPRPAQLVSPSVLSSPPRPHLLVSRRGSAAEPRALWAWRPRLSPRCRRRRRGGTRSRPGQWPSPAAQTPSPPGRPSANLCWASDSAALWQRGSTPPWFHLPWALVLQLRCRWTSPSDLLKMNICRCYNFSVLIMRRETISLR